VFGGMYLLVSEAAVPIIRGVGCLLSQCGSEGT